MIKVHNATWDGTKLFPRGNETTCMEVIGFYNPGRSPRGGKPSDCPTGIENDNNAVKNKASPPNWCAMKKHCPY